MNRLITLKIAATVAITFLHLTGNTQPETNPPGLPIDRESFEKVIQREFSQIVNGQPKALIGNFAALDLNDTKVSFNGSKIFNNLTAITLNASGNIDGGAYAIFNNSKINSNISLEMKFSSIIRRKDIALGSTISEMKKRSDNLDRIRKQYEILENKIDNDHRRLLASRDYLFHEIKQIESDNPSSVVKDFLIAMKKSQIDSIELILHNDFGDIPAKKKALTSSKKKALSVAYLDFELTRIKLQWIEFGYKVINKTFSLFDGSAPVPEQLDKVSFTSHRVSICFNKYKWSDQAFESHYLQLKGEIFYDDNRDDLSKNEITESHEYGSSPVSRTTNRKFIVYSGDYEQDVIGATLNADFYQFLFQQNTCAIHLYPNGEFSKGSGPIFNLGIGFMYSFKDKKDEKGKALINAELYFNLNDIGNERNTDRPVIDRNEIGLRFGLPLKFTSNN